LGERRRRLEPLVHLAELLLELTEDDVVHAGQLSAGMRLRQPARPLAAVPAPGQSAFMSRVAERSGLTEAEYLEIERASETKHEFFRGEMFAMAGVKREH